MSIRIKYIYTHTYTHTHTQFNNNNNNIYILFLYSFIIKIDSIKCKRKINRIRYKYIKFHRTYVDELITVNYSKYLIILSFSRPSILIHRYVKCLTGQMV